MGKNKGPQMTRSLYTRIKKMDHSQMSAFTYELYNEGYQDGKKASEGLTSDELLEVIKSVKGIGEKRAAAIVEAVVLKMEENHSKPEDGFARKE